MCSCLILAMVFVPTLFNITSLSHLYAMSIALCCILCLYQTRDKSLYYTEPFCIPRSIMS